MPSSVIQFFDYNLARQELTIGFVTGLIYKYLKVPERTFKLFQGATSKGRFFNDHIKDKFSFVKK